MVMITLFLLIFFIIYKQEFHKAIFLYKVKNFVFFSLHGEYDEKLKWEICMCLD